MKESLAIILALIVSAFGDPGASSVSFERLSAPSYKTRQAAQEEIFEWAVQNHEIARGILIKKYLQAPSPELRVRLLPILERAYFSPRGYVGIVMRPAYLDELGRPKNGQASGLGVRVMEVVAGTPAEKSGLSAQDIIVAINGWKVEGGQDLTSRVAEQIQKNPPLSVMKLGVLRGGEEREIELKLGLLPMPSERLAEAIEKNIGDVVEIRQQLTEFRAWLKAAIEKEKKNLIADRRS